MYKDPSTVDNFEIAIPTYFLYFRQPSNFCSFHFELFLSAELRIPLNLVTKLLNLMSLTAF